MTKKGNKQLTQDFIVLILMDFYETPIKTTFWRYCDENGLGSKRKSLQHIGNDIRLFELKTEG